MDEKRKFIRFPVELDARYSEKDEKALEYLRKAHEIDKTDELIIFNMGVFYKTLGKAEDAKKQFKYLIEKGIDKDIVAAAKQKLKEF